MSEWTKEHEEQIEGMIDCYSSEVNKAALIAARDELKRRGDVIDNLKGIYCDMEEECHDMRDELARLRDFIRSLTELESSGETEYAVDRMIATFPEEPKP